MSIIEEDGYLASCDPWHITNCLLDRGNKVGAIVVGFSWYSCYKQCAQLLHSSRNRFLHCKSSIAKTKGGEEAAIRSVAYLPA